MSKKKQLKRKAFEANLYTRYSLKSETGEINEEDDDQDDERVNDMGDDTGRIKRGRKKAIELYSTEGMV